MKEATEDQVRALKEFASAHGRTWKAELLKVWRTGTCKSPDLQRLRNTHGSGWLQKYKLPG